MKEQQELETKKNSKELFAELGELYYAYTVLSSQLSEMETRIQQIIYELKPNPVEEMRQNMEKISL